MRVSEFGLFVRPYNFEINVETHLSGETFFYREMTALNRFETQFETKLNIERASKIYIYKRQTFLGIDVKLIELSLKLYILVFSNGNIYFNLFFIIKLLVTFF